MTYTWINPPPGEYSTKEYLKMQAYYRKISSLDRNKLSPPVNLMNVKFFGCLRVVIVNEFVVRLEEIV